MKKNDFQISSNLNNIPMDVLKLYYTSAQQRLADYHKQANDTTDRAYKLISVYLGVLTLLYSYLYVNWSNTTTIMAILALAIGITVAAIFILKVILPRTYIPLGRSPEDFQIDYYTEYFNQEKYADDQKLKYIIKDELKVLQSAINTQYKKNRERTFMFTLSLLAAISGIVASSWIILI